MEKQLGLTNKHESIQSATYRTYGISLQSRHVVYSERHSYLAGTNRPLGNQNMEPGWYTHELCHHLPTNDATNRGLPMWRCSYVQFQFQGDIQPLFLYIMELEVITMLYYLFKPRTAPPSTRSHCFLLKNSAKKIIWRIASLLIMCICSKCGTVNIAWFKPSNVLPNDHSNAVPWALKSESSCRVRAPSSEDKASPGALLRSSKTQTS